MNGVLLRSVPLLIASCTAGSAPAAHTAPVPARVAAPLDTRAGPRVQSSAPVVEAAKPNPLSLNWQQQLTEPVSSLALGEGKRVAVLAREPYVGDERGFRALPLPAALRPRAGENDRVEIFWGRDNEPRIMGRRSSGDRERSIYFRHLPSGWRDGREEIGQLGSTTVGGLWGVLGAADPELVCRSNSICIIKRVSGWTRMPAGPASRNVILQGGVLWALDASGLSRPSEQGWVLVAPAPGWNEPDGFWADDGQAWVSAGGRFFHYRDSQWTSEPSPVGVEAHFWGLRSDSIWVTGSAGAAHFDGERFRAVAVPGPLCVVRGRSDDELWFGGEAGLFRAGPVP